MNRTEQIQRAWSRVDKNVFSLNPRDSEQLAFEMGARFADLHPLFEADIPTTGPKTDGEVLAIVRKLAMDENAKQYSLLASDGCKNPFRLVFEKMKQNTVEGKELFYGITFKINEE